MSDARLQKYVEDITTKRGGDDVRNSIVRALLILDGLADKQDSAIRYIDLDSVDGKVDTFNNLWEIIKNYYPSLLPITYNRSIHPSLEDMTAAIEIAHTLKDVGIKIDIEDDGPTIQSKIESLKETWTETNTFYMTCIYNPRGGGTYEDNIYVLYIGDALNVTFKRFRLPYDGSNWSWLMFSNIYPWDYIYGIDSLTSSYATKSMHLLANGTIELDPRWAYLDREGWNNEVVVTVPGSKIRELGLQYIMFGIIPGRMVPEISSSYYRTLTNNTLGIVEEVKVEVEITKSTGLIT